MRGHPRSDLPQNRFTELELETSYIMIQLELESLEGLGWATSLYLQCFYHDQAHKNFKFKASWLPTPPVSYTL